MCIQRILFAWVLTPAKIRNSRCYLGLVVLVRMTISIHLLPAGSNYMQAYPPFLSLYIPHPVNIYILSNTFVRFLAPGSDREQVGLIVDIDSINNYVTIRHIFTQQELKQHIGEDLLQGISLWPQDSHCLLITFVTPMSLLYCPLILCWGLLLYFIVMTRCYNKLAGWQIHFSSHHT